MRPPGKDEFFGSRIPGWGPERSARPHPTSVASPLPLLPIKFVRRYGIQRQLVFRSWACGLEGFFPALAWLPVRGDNQAVPFHAQIDRIANTTLIDYGLGNPDTSGVTDTHQFNFHRMACDYIVSTLHYRSARTISPGPRLLPCGPRQAIRAPAGLDLTNHRHGLQIDHGNGIARVQRGVDMRAVGRHQQTLTVV